MGNNDLISRKSLMDYTLNQKSKTIDCNDIARFPAAEAVRHGRWIAKVGRAACSVCFDECWADSVMEYHYCPNCGAKMDLER